MIDDEILDEFRVRPGKRLHLADHDPEWAKIPAVKGLDKQSAKERTQELMVAELVELSAAQALLWANDTHSLLLIFQAMDAAGKDSTIKHVMSGVNPQGCEVTSFKKPSDEELDHTFLWRCAKEVPERGMIGIFNRSHYEEVLVVKVHPELLEGQRLPPGRRGKSFWRARYDDINRFERHLSRNGTVVRKFFLHVSKAEQKRRFLARLDEPEKHWKFSAPDLAERPFWDAYMLAYEDALSETSTKWAPWYVIPADHKWVTRAVVAALITSTIRGMKLSYPEPSDDKRRELAEARRILEAEPD
jgi:PPK2 family polyphosphate:nucleotide phosphotransferase